MLFPQGEAAAHTTRISLTAFSRTYPEKPFSDLEVKMGSKLVPKHTALNFVSFIYFVETIH
jgi:hypothetical protein